MASIPPIVRTSAALPIGQALENSAPLARLRGLLRESNARYAAIAPLLPPALAEQVSPGPVTEEGWALLAANSAVAAKLRQLAPRLEATLKAQGWTDGRLRIRVRKG